MRIVTTALALVALHACGDNRPPDLPPSSDPGRCTPQRGRNVLLRQIVTLPGDVPLLVTAPPGDERQFIVLRSGRIAILDHGELRAPMFLDISVDAGGPVVIGSERGLLGLAFHPDYATTGFFFVFYTTATHNVVARYRRLDDNTADAASGEIVLEIEHPRGNHNGGMIELGADGMLYIGTGDGGGGGDPDLASEDPFQLLGKMLRIDVDQVPYAIPPDNPFADGLAGAPEVYMLGLRNPWRWSFDPANGDLWIGDVGQDLVEELDVIPAANAPGANLGWSTFEGTSCFRPPCDPIGRVPPAVERDRTIHPWCSVIAGAVYRGSCYPELVGEHLFTDYCAHELELARRRGDTVTVRKPRTRFLDLDGTLRDGFPVTPSSIHPDSTGELFVTTVSCCGSSFIGAVYRVEAEP